MNDQQNDPQAQTVFLGDPEAEADARAVIALVNQIGMATATLRMSGEQPETDSLLMTAAVTFAGTIYGQIAELGGPDFVMPDAELARFLSTNFKSGEQAGRRKTRRAKAACVGSIAEGMAANETDLMGLIGKALVALSEAAKRKGGA